MQAAKWLHLISKQWVSSTINVHFLSIIKPHFLMSENHSQGEKNCQTWLKKQTKAHFHKGNIIAKKSEFWKLRNCLQWFIHKSLFLLILHYFQTKTFILFKVICIYYRKYKKFKKTIKKRIKLWGMLPLRDSTLLTFGIVICKVFGICIYKLFHLITCLKIYIFIYI